MILLLNKAMVKLRGDVFTVERCRHYTPFVLYWATYPHRTQSRHADASATSSARSHRTMDLLNMLAGGSSTTVLHLFSGDLTYGPGDTWLSGSRRTLKFRECHG